MDVRLRSQDSAVERAIRRCIGVVLRHVGLARPAGCHRVADALDQGRSRWRTESSCGVGIDRRASAYVRCDDARHGGCAEIRQDKEPDPARTVITLFDGDQHRDRATVSH